MSAHPYPVRHAGLWRCCVAHAERTEPRGPEDVIECPVCRSSLVWTGTEWAWSLATVAPEVERDADGMPRGLWP